MGALETTAALADYDRRGPGTDAERRAARWLARELWKQGHRVSVEPFWCRPNWALAHAWHVALALAGSLLSVSHPTVGAVLLAVALLSIAVDALAGASPGRRLTPEHASQNVVAAPATEGTDAKPVRLIVTANYDVGRSALVYRDALRRPAAWLRRAAGPFALGWLGTLSLAIIWLLAIAVIRIALPHPGRALDVIQLSRASASSSAWRCSSRPPAPATVPRPPTTPPAPRWRSSSCARSDRRRRATSPPSYSSKAPATVRRSGSGGICAPTNARSGETTPSCSGSHRPGREHRTIGAATVGSSRSRTPAGCATSPAPHRTVAAAARRHSPQR